MGVVHVIFTRSDGRELRFDDMPMGVKELKGFDAPSVEVFTEKNAIGDGDVVTGKRVASRLIEVKASSRVLGLNEQMRKIVSAFFNPSYSYDVKAVYGNFIRTARKCEIKALAVPMENLYKRLNVSVSLLSPTGYLEGDGLYGKDINAVTGRLGWPFVSVANVGFIYGKFDFSRTIEVFNDGDAPTFIRAVFTVKGEDPVENPVLIKGDAFVKLNTLLYPGDELEIDTENRVVRINGQNALNLVDKTSKWKGMVMQQGDNTFGFGADSHDNQLMVRIYYAKRYYGVG